MRSLQADVTEIEESRQQRRRIFRRTRWFLIRFRLERWRHDRVRRSNARICQTCAMLSHVRGSSPWVGPRGPTSPRRRPRDLLAVCQGSSPCVGLRRWAPTPPRRAVGGPPPLVAVPCGFVGFLHRTTSQFDLSRPCRHQSLPTDDLCPCWWWIQP